MTLQLTRITLKLKQKLKLLTNLRVLFSSR
jgi:hypothetical protein